jgi:hypothetical protein
MRIGVMLLLLAGSAGCVSSRPNVPPVDEIASIKLSVHQFPKDAGRNNPCEATLTKRQDLADVLEWLDSVDWSQPGIDLAVVKMKSPEGDVLLTLKDGTTSAFSFYWDGGVVNKAANRLHQGANTTKLRAVALRMCP